MRFIWLFLAASSVVAGHTTHWGRTCPAIDAFPNLVTSKITGIWFMIHKFDSSNKCVVWNITSHSDETLSVTETREFPLLNSVSLDHRHKITAQLDIPNPEVPSRMRVRWPTSVTGKADFVVFDTDYTNFMAVFECDRAGFYHRRSVAILSRTDTIEQRFVDRVKAALKQKSIPHGALQRVDHGSCKTNSRYNWHIDGELFGLLGPSRPAGSDQRSDAQTQVAVDDGFGV